MKHITPQTQNHIFKERRDNPLPFQETTSFITLHELKVLDREVKFSMNSDSDGYDCMDDTNDANEILTNDETFTTEGKETYECEEDETYEDEEEFDVNVDVAEVHDAEDEHINEEKLRQELTTGLKKKTPYRSTSKRSKKVNFTMQYELVENTW